MFLLFIGGGVSDVLSSANVYYSGSIELHDFSILLEVTLPPYSNGFIGSEDSRAELLFIWRSDCGLFVVYRRERNDSEARRELVLASSSSLFSGAVGLLNLFFRLTKVTFEAEIILELLTICDPFDLELLDGFFV